MSWSTKYLIGCHQHAWDFEKVYYYTGNHNQIYPPTWNWRKECGLAFYSREIAEQWIKKLVTEGITSNYNVLIDGTLLAMFIVKDDKL